MILRLFILITMISGSISATDGILDLPAKIKEMRKNQQIFLNGWTENTGIYIISIERVHLTGNIKEAEATELALAAAKKGIAAFLGQSISSSETLSYLEDQNGSKEFYSSLQKIDIKQFLRGVTVYSVQKDKESLEAVCYVFSRTGDMAAELAKKLKEFPPGTVGAVGIAVISGNRLDQAKQAAVNSALRSAVEQVLGTVLAANTQVQDNEKIKACVFAHTSGFVDQYRILEEKQEAGNYQVTLIASVQKEKLLDSYRAYMQSFGDPKFFLATHNKELYLTFSEFFTGLGLKLSREQQNADYIINAFGEFQRLKHPINATPGIQLSLWIRIYDAKSNQELLSQKNDPRKAAVFHGSESRQVELTTEKAFAQIKQPLHEAINKMIGKMITSGRPVRVVIENYGPTYEQALEKICEAVEMVPGVSNINRKVDSLTQEVVFVFDYQGKMDDLDEFLRDRLKKDISNSQMIPQLKSLETNRLILSY